jgi:hypothetical protein
MWLFFLACHTNPTPTDRHDDRLSGGGADTASGDTSGDTGADTGGDTGPDDSGLIDAGVASDVALDACVEAGRVLTERWAWTPEGGPPRLRSLAYAEGRLALIAGEGELFAFEAPADGSRLTRVGWQPATAPWSRLLFDADGAVVVVGGDEVGRWDLAADRLDRSDWPENTAPLLTVAAAPGGLQLSSADWTASFTGGATRGDRLDTGLEAVSVLAGDADRRWVGGLLWGVPAVGLAVAGEGVGFRAPRTLPMVMGAPTGIVLLPDGGAFVSGGPEAYGWFARFDAEGELIDSVQYESPAIPTVVGSPGSAYPWSFFQGMGAFASVPEAGWDYRWAVSSDDLTDLLVDPEGRWLLTAHEDGSLRRFECVR